MEKALVLFSGGQDSTTCLAWALNTFEMVETIGFKYGQRHSVELTCRKTVRERMSMLSPSWSERLGEDHVMDLPILKEISATALTREIDIDTTGKLPNTFVPGRNILFLVIAAAIAYSRGTRHIVGGMCETDFSGYPDCRDDTIKTMQVALNLGMDAQFVLHTPLMWIDKAETWRLANNVGGEEFVRLIIDETHTCYFGDRTKRHPWGSGCANCPACELRAVGYESFMKSVQMQ